MLPHNPRIVMGGDNHPVARTDVACRIRKGSDEYALCAANARLITAAPELLAALKACASRLALHAVHGNMDVIDAARAAIAKAEGL